MRALKVYAPGLIESHPLRLEEVPVPEPEEKQVQVRVSACALCHTDLHIIEGELVGGKMPVTPGHQVIGRVEKLGLNCTNLSEGTLVGIPWLYQACGKCWYCLRGEENLCEYAKFTGFSADGGFAESMVVPEDFAHPLPPHWDAVQMAPLMCAGVIGYRTIRVAEVQKGEKVGLIGFGASAHLVLQILAHWECQLYVFTRSREKYALAKKLGAVWAGSLLHPLEESLDRVLYFAPAGALIPPAMRLLRRGGTMAIAAVYLDSVPALSYSSDLYWEKSIRSVANSTRQDVRELISLAEEIPLIPEVKVYPVDRANEAFARLKQGAIHGAAVLRISD